jgi:hypothetical protein
MSEKPKRVQPDTTVPVVHWAADVMGLAPPSRVAHMVLLVVPKRSAGKFICAKDTSTWDGRHDSVSFSKAQPKNGSVVGDGVADLVAVAVAVTDTVFEPVGENVGVTEKVGEYVAEYVAENVAEYVGVTDGVAVAEYVGVTDADTNGDASVLPTAFTQTPPLDKHLAWPTNVVANVVSDSITPRSTSRSPGNM